jgi:hypothetical protein
MQIVINIEKGHFYAIVLAICLLGGGAVVAYHAGGDQTGNPVEMGHSLSELSGGLMDLGDVDCNAYDTDDCLGNLRGLTIQASPLDGLTILHLKDKRVYIPGDDRGNALKVEGSAMFTDGPVTLSKVAQDQGWVGSGNFPLCIVRSTGNDNGNIIAC